MIDFNTETSEIAFVDIHDTSVLELTILQFLANYRNKILRYDLYKEINALLTPHKKLSTSSFYNSLQKLEKKELLIFGKADNKDPKSLTVQKTDKTMRFIGYMYFYFANYSLNLNQKRQSIPMDVIKKLSNKELFDAVMVIEPDTYTSGKMVTSVIPSAMDTMKSIAQISRAMSLLTVQDMYERYFNNTPGSEVSPQFDLIIYPLADENINYNNMSYDSILKDITSLLVPGGRLIIVHLDTPEATESFFVQHYLFLLNQSGLFNTFDRDFIDYKMQKLEYEDITKVSYDGISYVSGTIPATE